MDRSRRYAQNFTDSINEFHNTSIMENDTNSTDSSDRLKSLECSIKFDSSPASPILARGFNARQNFSLHNTSSDTSTMENTCNLLDETIFVPSSDNTTKSTVYMDLPTWNCKVKTSDVRCSEIETVCINADSKADALETDKFSVDAILSSPQKDACDKLEYCSPTVLLTSEDEGMSNSHSFQRLLQSYSHSPRNFTERLLTIIEESIVNSNCDLPISPTLTKFMNEVENNCKFIQDESMLEMVSDTLNATSSNVETSPMKSNPCAMAKSPNRRVLATPQNQLVRRCKKVYRKTPVKLFKSNNSIMIDNTSTFNNTTYDFEQLEALLEIYYGENMPSKKSSISEAALMERKRIQEMAEKQLAALSDSTANSPAQNKLKTLVQCNSGSERFEPKDQIQFLHNETEDTKYEGTGIDEFRDNLERMDNLDKSLLLQVAEKRQRCLDTAMVVMNIDSDSKIPQTLSGDVPESNKNSPLTPSLNNNNRYFVNTLMNCTEYYSFLEKHKSLFADPKSQTQKENNDPNIKNETPSRPRKQISNTLKASAIKSTRSASKTPNPLPQILVVSPKSPLPDANSNLPVSEKKRTYNKPRYFTTPGKKSPVQSARSRKPTYFPRMHSPTNDMMRLNREKSVTPKKSPKISRLKTYFETKPIVSPVAMYIRGEEAPFAKKLTSNRVKNNMLLGSKEEDKLQPNLATVGKKSPRTPKTPSNVLSLRKTPKSMSSLNQRPMSFKTPTKLFTSPTFEKTKPPTSQVRENVGKSGK